MSRKNNKRYSYIFYTFLILFSIIFIGILIGLTSTKLNIWSKAEPMGNTEEKLTCENRNNDNPQMKCDDVIDEQCVYGQIIYKSCIPDTRGICQKDEVVGIPYWCGWDEKEKRNRLYNDNWNGQCIDRKTCLTDISPKPNSQPIKHEIRGVSFELPATWNQNQLDQILIGGFSYREANREKWDITFNKPLSSTLSEKGDYYNHMLDQMDISLHMENFFNYPPIYLNAWAVAKIINPVNQEDLYLCIKSGTLDVTMYNFAYNRKIYSKEIFQSPGWVICDDYYPDLKTKALEVTQ